MATKYPIPEDLSIPEWLIISAEDRKAAWEKWDREHPKQAPARYIEEWERKAEERRADEKRRQKEKNAAAFARMVAKHPGEVYDRKTRSWIPDPKITATVTENGDGNG